MLAIWEGVGGGESESISWAKPRIALSGRAKLMAHAGKEIRFREVGFLRGGLGALQLDVGFLERLLVAFALRDVPRDGQYALQRPIPVVEGGGVVGHLCFLAIPGARGEFVVGDFLLAQHQLDGRFGPLRIGKVVLGRRADQLIARAAGERLHLLVDVGNNAERIGGHQRVDVGFDERARVELLVAQALIELFLFRFPLLARGGFGLLPNELLADTAVLILEVFAAELSAQAGLENVEVGGLGNVVVGAGVDAFDHRIPIVARREHDEGDVAPFGSLFDALARVLAGQSRHDEVEQNAVHRLSREEFQRLLAGACHDHMVTFPAKLATELLKVGVAVVDGEQALGAEEARARLATGSNRAAQQRREANQDDAEVLALAHISIRTRLERPQSVVGALGACQEQARCASQRRVRLETAYHGGSIDAREYAVHDDRVRPVGGSQRQALFPGGGFPNVVPGAFERLSELVAEGHAVVDH